jgi:hypothetical protein
MRKVVPVVLAFLVTLVAAGSVGALPPGLARSATTSFETAFSVGWSFAERMPMLGWRFTVYGLVPVDFVLDVLIGESGGYATVQAVKTLAIDSLGDSVGVPVGAGLGIARSGDDLSPVLAASAGAAWYPLTLSDAPGNPWILVIGEEIAATLFLASWGLDLAPASRALVGANLSD